MNLYNNFENTSFEKKKGKSKETITFYCTFLYKTEHAILILYDKEKIWIPLSSIIDIQGKQMEYNTIELEVQEWIAVEKEII